MTPPREIRNFTLGFSHPLPDLSLNPTGRSLRSSAASAAGAETIAQDIEHSAALDRFSLEPSIRYRPDLAGYYSTMSDRQLEIFVHDSLVAGRGGERVRYYDTLASQFALLQRSSTERMPALTRQFVSALEEYSNFLQYTPHLTTEERLRFLFAAARIGQTYLSQFRRPPAGTTLPDPSEELESTLAAALDEVDSQLQSYHAQLVAESYPLLPRLTGVMEIVALRRALHAGDRDSQRRHALALADHLSFHPPTALDSTWHARAERGLLEDPEIIAQLRRFDAPSQLEAQAFSLNAHSLEWLILAAASIDRANEDPEEELRTRYRGFSAVVTTILLNHPEWGLDELLRRLRSPAEEAALVEEMSRAQLRNSAIAGLLTDARGGRGLAELLLAARETATHIERLGYGPGRRLIPNIIEGNRRHHPLQNVESELLRTPELIRELQLPPIRPGLELLRRRGSGIAQLEELQSHHPQLQIQGLLRLLRNIEGSPSALAVAAEENLETWQGQLSQASDAEILAIHSLLNALEEGRQDEGIPPALRIRARTTRERMNGAEFRGRRMLGHLFSSSSLIGLGAGILVAEFLPSLLIARAGASGSLALRGLPLVARGSLTPFGSVLSGLGVGASLSFFGAAAHNLDLNSQGLRTHFWRDFGTSAGINLLTFGLSIPFSRLLQNRLLARSADPFLLGGFQARHLAVHTGTVAFASATALGLGVLGRGFRSGEWRISGEEIAENVLSIALWESGAAGLRNLRGRTLGYGGQLGAHRLARLQELVPELIAREPRLAGREALLTRLLARGEARQPGTLERYRQGIAEGRVPQLFLRGRRSLLRLADPSEIPRSVETPMPASSTPAAEPSRPVFIIWERQPILRLPANTEVQRASRSSETLETASRPVALEDSPFRLVVEAQPESGETSGIIEFSELNSDAENGRRILGRSDFRFLSQELRRTLSRAHLEFSIGEDGGLFVRQLGPGQALGPEASDFHGSWVLREGEWLPIPRETSLALGGEERIAMGSRMEPVQLQVLPNLSPPLSRVSLSPGGRLSFGNFRLIRTGEESIFRLAGPGETPIEVIRSLGSDSGQPRSYRATDNPVIGEIGEEVFVRIGEREEQRSYRLFLDSPDRPSSTLPEIALQYSGNDWSGRFRATEATLDFGRIHQNQLFTAPFISRNHFSIRIGSHEGHPRYFLFVEAPHGLAIGSQHFSHGSRLVLMSGYYQLAFPMDNGGRAYDAPFQMHLPPIEGSFVEWRADPLLAGHDRAVPPPPAAPPEPPPLPRQRPTADTATPQAHPASTARRPNWRNLWGWIDE